MNRPLSSRDLEILSAYLDKQLSPGEQRRLEERLHTNPAMQSALDELRRTRAMLRSLPKVRAPRNFTLSANMVPARPRPLFWGVSLSWSAASAMATLLLLIIFVGDFLGNFSPVRSLQTAERPAEALALETAMSQIDQQVEMAKQAATQEPEMVVPLVAENTRGMGGGGGGSGGGDAGPVITLQADMLVVGTPQPELAQPSLGFRETLTLTTTTVITTPSMLQAAPAQPMTETMAIQQTAATEVAVVPSLEQPVELEQESPQFTQVVFTPLWVRLVELALLLVAIGAGLFAILRRRML